MPNTNDRQSLNLDLQSRYTNQKAGSTFDVKKTLGNPGSTPKTGTTIDSTSIQGTLFQNPKGFEVKVPQGQTQMKDAQSNKSLQLSRFMSGFDNRKYRR